MMLEDGAVTKTMEFDSSETCVELTKRALSKVLDKNDLEFLDKAMRLYAAYVVRESENDDA
jgi:hypothetical protein